KVPGRRPLGLWGPERTSATAVPPSSPGYHASRIAAACCCAQLIPSALPLVSTTMSGFPVAATASRSSCCGSGTRLIKDVAAVQLGRVDEVVGQVKLRELRVSNVGC